MFRAEPSAEHADFYERALFNHILSTEHPVHGGFTYFTPIRPRHYRVYWPPSQCVWCCVGTGMENHGKYRPVHLRASDTSRRRARSRDWRADRHVRSQAWFACGRGLQRAAARCPVNDVEITRRALLQGAALTAGALVRPARARFAIAAQAVSTVTVRIIFLPPATAGRENLASISLVPEDGALVRREWPRQPVTRGAPGSHLSKGVRLHVAEDLAVTVTADGRVVQQLRPDLTTNSLSFLLGRGPLSWAR